jgi:hypothetical protein
LELPEGFPNNRVRKEAPEINSPPVDLQKHISIQKYFPFFVAIVATRTGHQPRRPLEPSASLGANLKATLLA